MASGPRGTRERARAQGAYTAGGGDGPRKRRGWLLGVLALLLLAVLLTALLSGGDEEKPSGAKPSPSAEAAAPAQAGAGSAAGSLTARNQSLLPVPSGGLDTYETETATGRQVTVQSVVKDEGFWVSTSARDRVYVEYGGDVGENEAQSPAPAVGDKVDLTGEMRPAPEDPGRTLKLADQDAQQVSQQGAYINADTVETR